MADYYLAIEDKDGMLYYFCGEKYTYSANKAEAVVFKSEYEAKLAAVNMGVGGLIIKEETTE